MDAFLGPLPGCVSVCYRWSISDRARWIVGLWIALVPNQQCDSYSTASLLSPASKLASDHAMFVYLTVCVGVCVGVLLVVEKTLQMNLTASCE